MKVLVGSRGSKLALTQANWVIDKLREVNPEMDFEIKVIKTKGDKINDIALDKIGDKGLFVREIEEALLKGEIDMAVHSMKDMPSSQPDGLKLAAAPKREDYRDVLILKEGLDSLEDVPQGAKIGTGSKRRKYQLLNIRPDLDIVPIRGNIDTRIRKVEEGELHGIVLAAAGVLRLGLENIISCYLDTDIMVPAPAQGVLAIEIRDKDNNIESMINKISHKSTEIQVKAERAFLKAIDGGCHIPMGAICIINDDKLVIKGVLGSEDGSVLVQKSVEGSLGQEEELGKRLAADILKEMKRFEG